ncbi:MAG: SCO family protein [Pseudomonadota bacterium]
MNKWFRRPLRACKQTALAVALVIGVTATPVVATEALPYYADAAFTPLWLTAAEAERQRIHRIPEFAFRNQYGDVVDQDAVAGQVVVANFFFATCSGICPMIRDRLQAVQTAYTGVDDVVILTHTIRPTVDTEAVLKAYARINNIQANKWHLLRGERDALYDFAQRAYFANEDLGKPQADDNFLHSENVLLIDRRGHIRGVYNGLSETAIEHLVADIAVLLAESM